MSKKILILTHEFLPFRGGVATYCAEIASAAVELGHDVTVLAPDYLGDNHAEDVSKPYRVARFPGNLYRTRSMPRVLWEVIKIDPSAYDIVHAADWSFAVACHVLYPFKKLRFLTTLHGTDIFGFDTSRVTRLLKAKEALRHAWMVTANSHFTANLAGQYHPYYPRKRIVPTHLGVSPFWFEPAGEGYESLWKKYNIPLGRQIIVSVARLVPRKGHACVLEALTLLTQAEKDRLVYVIVGGADDQDYANHLHALAERCGMPVLFLGKLGNEDVRSLYKASWVFCLPGRKDPKRIEGFGLVYLEAAAQALPSIATPVGGVSEVIVDGKTGWLLKDHSAEILAETLSTLLRSPEQVSEFGKAAKDWARGFSWRRCAEQTYNNNPTGTA